MEKLIIQGGMLMENNKLGTMTMKKLVLVNGIPLMLSLLISNLYNFVDSIFVSRISETALTALSLANPIQVLMSALGVANAVGVNAVISKALGKKDEDEIKNAASASIWLAFVFWIILALLEFVLIKPYFEFQTGGNQEIMNYGIQYLSIVMLGSLGVMGQWVFDRFTISSGKSSLFLITLSSGAITNIILDPIFIFGYFGVPAMGIKGAAIATVIGQFVGASMGIIINKKFNKEIPIHFVLKPNFSSIKSILHVGVPSGIAQGMLSIMGMYVNNILISFSPTAVAVYGACAKIQSLVLVPIWGFNNGLVPIVAYNYGAKKLERSHESVKWTLLYEYGIYFFLFLFIEFFPQVILNLFNTSESMMSMGVYALRVLGIAYFISILCLAYSSMLQGFSRGTEAMILTLTRQTIMLFIFLTIAKILNQIHFIWWAYVLAELTSIPIGIWLKNKVKKQVEMEM